MQLTNYEWRAFGKINEELSSKLKSLNLTFLEQDLFTDEYLWRPGCTVNAKLRYNRLKFKKLQQTTSDGIEIWVIQDLIPFDSWGLSLLESEMQVKSPKELKTVGRSSQSLMELLNRFTPPLFCLSVDKFRTKYLYKRDGVAISIELAEIQKPVQTSSFCIECNGMRSSSLNNSIVDTIRKLRNELGLPGTMQIKSYLTMVEEWMDL